MLQPKFVQSMILLLFIGTVSVGIFFLLRMQLAPIMDEVAVNTAAIKRTRTEAADQPLAPTATMPALTLAMLATLQPTTTVVAPTVAASLPLSTVAAPINPNARLGIVTDDAINIRSYPSLAGEVVGQAQRGDQVEIITTSNDGKWLQVCCPLGTAEGYQQSWIAAEFITIQQPAVSTTTVQSATTLNPITTSKPELDVTAANTLPSNTITQSNSSKLWGTINGAVVNLRSGPGTNYVLVGQASEQTQVEITGRDEAGNWWRICCPVGAPPESWISAELVDLSVPKAEALLRIRVVPAPALTPTNTTGNLDKAMAVGETASPQMVANADPS